MFKYLWILIIITGCSVTVPYYLNLRKEKRETFTLKPPDINLTNTVLSINSRQFDSIINLDTLNFKLIIFFTYWCPNSADFLPELVTNLPLNGLRTFFVSPDDWVYKHQYQEYMQYLKLKDNIYLLDVNSYGEKRSPHYRMDKFVSEICDICQEIKGFPSFILYDDKNKIVLTKVGNISIDNITDLITKSP